MEKKKSKLRIREARNGLLFITPWIFGFLVFTLYPIVASLYYSLCNYSVIKAPVFIGLQNYKALFQDKVFLKTISNTLYMMCLGVPITTIIAVGVSVNKRTWLAVEPDLVKAVVYSDDDMDLWKCDHHLFGWIAGYFRNLI